GVDPRREEYAGSEVSGAEMPDYKSKYSALQQVIKDNYQLFEVDYYGVDNDDYVAGAGFCCESGGANTKSIPIGGDTYEKLQYYYHPDHLGSASYITNLDGEVVQHIEYVSFGEVFLEERNNTWNTPFLFNGKEYDAETGLYYYGARYYNPRASQFLSVDPLADHPNQIGMSPYSAMWNNPIRYNDPDGRCPECPDGMYSIQGGDNFWNLENQWGLDHGSLAQWNPGLDPSNLQVGQSIVANSDIAVNSPFTVSSTSTTFKTETVTTSSNTVKYAGAAAIALVADDATVIGVADDPLLIGVGIWAVGALIYDAANSGTSTITTPITTTTNNPAPFNYVTYTKTSADGQVYVGRSSGYGDPASIVARRDANHHMTGYGTATLSTFAPATIPGGYATRALDPSYWAIRGSEQVQIEAYRKAGISGNSINGIGPNNPNLQKYLDAAKNVLKQ
ncbi:MAG: RHS repeat domain-containing protein, partial [Bacteroidales bacterium]